MKGWSRFGALYIKAIEDHPQFCGIGQRTGRELDCSLRMIEGRALVEVKCRFALWYYVHMATYEIRVVYL